MASITQYIGPNRKILDVRRFEQAIQSALNTAQREAEVGYINTVKTWQHDVPFIVRRLSAWERLVGTDDLIYHYVNHGTVPHDIRPRTPGGILAFQSGYRAKTIPNVAFSRAGGAFGPTVVAREVHHPGSEARNFDTVIATRIQDRMAGWFNLGIADAIR